MTSAAHQQRVPNSLDDVDARYDSGVANQANTDGGRNEHRYFASTTAHDSELVRLRLLEEIHDPATIRRLERIGVGGGWSCLEVAAGGGSIAAWLGERVGSGGRVLAVDIDTRFLTRLSAPVEVRRVDLLTEELEPGSFDLVHARAILMHLRTPEAALAKMAAAVKPGGWLLVEDGHYEGLTALVGHPEAKFFTEAWRSLFRRYNQAGTLDSNIGLRLRPLLEGLGFEDVAADGFSEIWRGGERGAKFADMSWSAFHKAGMATDEEYERGARLMRDPTFYFKYGVYYGASGRRPN